MQKTPGIQQLALAGIVLLAFLYRVMVLPLDLHEDLAFGPDGEWTVAMASLGPQRFLELLAYEIHPPLFYALLWVWMSVAGKSAWAIKYVTLLLGVLTVPATYGLGTRLGSKAIGLLLALLLAFSSLHVTQSLVTRDAALMLLWGTLSLYLLARLLTQQEGLRSKGAWSLGLGYVLVNVVGLLSSYLFGLYLVAEALIVIFTPQGRRWWRPLVLAGLFSLLGALPWLAKVALIWIPHRLLTRGIVIEQGAHPWTFFTVVVQQLFLSEFAVPLGDKIAPVLGAILIVGLGLLLRRRPPVAPEKAHGLLGTSLGTVGLLSFLVLLALGWVYLFSAQARGLFDVTAPRYVLTGLPFFLLLLAFLVWLLRRLTPWLTAASVAAFIGLSVVGVQAYVTRPPLPEDLWNPLGMVRFLDEHVGPQDAVVFVSLGQAGYYESFSRHPAPWDYLVRADVYLRQAMPSRGEERLPALLERHRAVWLVLYSGGGEEDAPVVSWLNGFSYPAHGEWRSDSLVRAYIAAPGTQSSAPQSETFGSLFSLKRASWSSAAAPGGKLAVGLEWKAETKADRDYQVFVHLIDDQGQRWAQHDSTPHSGETPTSQWEMGQVVEDRHGLLLAVNTPPGTYWLEVGWYSPEGRLLLSDGADRVRLGPIAISEG